MKFLISLCLIFSLTPLFAQEICDNGIDDDGDLAIDLQDADCLCSVPSTGLIAEDFENYTDCPEGFGGILNIISDWEPAGTPQGANTCGFLGGAIFPAVPLPIPSGEGCIGIGSDEGIVKCLPSCSLLSGETYTFEIDAVDFTQFGTTVEYVLYGRSSCAGIPSGPSDYTYDWLDNCSPNFQWTALVTVTGSPGTNPSWESLSGSFTADANYGALLIAFSCDNPAYSYIDNIRISGDFAGTECDDAEPSPEILTEQLGDCVNGSSITVSSDSAIQYQWYLDGVAILGQTDSTFNVVPYVPGEYQVRAIFPSGLCTVSESVTLGINDLEVLNFDFTTTDPLCIGEESGVITPSVSSPNLPYTYNWSTGSQDSILTNLGTGNYTLTITDSAGCFGVFSESIIDPDPLSANLLTTAPVCIDEATGSIEIVPADPNDNYTYIWSDGSTQATLSNVGAGDYSVTVTNSNGCTNTFNTSLSNPQGLQFNITSNPILCFNGTSGSIDLTTDDPLNSFEYFWDTGNDTPSITDLGAGNYSVTVSDENGCSETYTTEVTQPDPFLLNTTINQPSFTTGGSIELFPEGGTPPYSFDWNNGSTNELLSNLEVGIFTVTATDEYGCTAVATVELSDPLLGEDILDKIYIPNTFSPNNDGLNDLFQFYLTQQSLIRAVKEFRIFDRWGGQVYQELNKETNTMRFWNGTKNNKKVLSGVYAYLIVLESYSGEELVFKGDITCVR
jgi:gliding motility-associated-like protein